MASNLDRATMALRNADAAGDVSAATKLAGYVRSMMPAMDRPPTSPIAKAAQSMRQPAPAPQMPLPQAPSPIARVNQQAVAQRPPGPPVTSLASPMAEAILGVLPGSGDAMAAKESQQAGQAMVDALRGGDYGKAASSGIEAAVLGLGALPMIPALGGMIKAFHGTPHKFDAFDISKIGTGEGAQAYGHGLYFAENPKVAGDYKRKFAGVNPTKAARKGANVPELKAKAMELYPSNAEDQGAYVLLHQVFDFNKGGIDDAITEAKQWTKGFDTTDQAVERVAKDLYSEGSLYNVSLDVNPEDLLDWDAPLSQQSEKVRKALTSIMESPDFYGKPYKMGQELPMRGYTAQGTPRTELTGGEVYKLLAPTDDAASRALADAGIPGLRYLDAGSRRGPTEQDLLDAIRGTEIRIQKNGPSAKDTEHLAFLKKQLDDAKETRNVVMFTDKGIKIEGKQ